VAGAGSTLRRADVLWRRVVDGVLILPRGAEQPVLLTGSGVALWDELTEPAPFDELVARLALAHRVERELAAADLDPVIEDLVDRGVLIDG
jgi:hypothetical protein